MDSGSAAIVGRVARFRAGLKASSASKRLGIEQSHAMTGEAFSKGMPYTMDARIQSLSVTAANVSAKLGTIQIPAIGLR